MRYRISSELVGHLTSLMSVGAAVEHELASHLEQGLFGSEASRLCQQRVVASMNLDSGVNKTESSTEVCVGGNNRTMVFRIEHEVWS